MPRRFNNDGVITDVAGAATSNTNGALLAQVAAVERGYQVVTFEEREPSASETAASSALTLGDQGRREIRGQELQFTPTS